MISYRIEIQKYNSANNEIREIDYIIHSAYIFIR